MESEDIPISEVGKLTEGKKDAIQRICKSAAELQTICSSRLNGALKRKKKDIIFSGQGCKPLIKLK